MILYEVCNDDYEDNSTIAIFESEEKANQYLLTLTSSEKRGTYIRETKTMDNQFDFSEYKQYAWYDANFSVDVPDFNHGSRYIDYDSVYAKVPPITPEKTIIFSKVTSLYRDGKNISRCTVEIEGYYDAENNYEDVEDTVMTEIWGYIQKIKQLRESGVSETEIENNPELVFGGE